MELFQLRYFREVVRSGGVNKASVSLSISAPAISKAISNLEDSLEVGLFERVGRNLRLTEEGKHFLKRVEEILTLAEKTRLEFARDGGVSEVTLAGREIFLEHYGLKISKLIKGRFPEATVRFLECSGREALKAVDEGRSHFALTLQNPPTSWGTVRLGTVASVTAVGRGHKLYPLASKGQAIHVKEVLKHSFASPNLPFFGRAGEAASIDGWRDDVHPRKFAYTVNSLALLRKLLAQGDAVGYIPEFWARDIGLERLHIDGCAFTFKQQLFCSAKRANDFGWLAAIMENLKSRKG